MPAPWSRGAQVRILGELHGSETVNVMNFGTNTVINDNPQEFITLLTALATAMLQCVIENLVTATTAEWKVRGVEARLIHPTPSDPVFVPAEAGTEGTLSATSVSFVASLVHIRTGLGGRSGRGRIFLPPPGEAEINQSVLTQPALDNLLTFVTCVVGKFIGANPSTPWRLGVLSRKKVGDPPAAQSFNDAFREAITLEIDSTLAKLGSRKKGKGS